MDGLFACDDCTFWHFRSDGRCPGSGPRVLTMQRDFGRASAVIWYEAHPVEQEVAGVAPTAQKNSTSGVVEAVVDGGDAEVLARYRRRRREQMARYRAKLKGAVP